MIFKHYGKFIRNRTRKDGRRFLEGLQEAEVGMALAKAEPDPEVANHLPSKAG